MLPRTDSLSSLPRTKSLSNVKTGQTDGNSGPSQAKLARSQSFSGTPTTKPGGPTPLNPPTPVATTPNPASTVSTASTNTTAGNASTSATVITTASTGATTPTVATTKLSPQVQQQRDQLTAKYQKMVQEINEEKDQLEQQRNEFLMAQIEKQLDLGNNKSQQRKNSDEIKSAGSELNRLNKEEEATETKFQEKFIASKNQQQALAQQQADSQQLDRQIQAKTTEKTQKEDQLYGPNGDDGVLAQLGREKRNLQTAQTNVNTNQTAIQTAQTEFTKATKALQKLENHLRALPLPLDPSQRRLLDDVKKQNISMGYLQQLRSIQQDLIRLQSNVPPFTGNAQKINQERAETLFSLLDKVDQLSQQFDNELRGQAQNKSTEMRAVRQALLALRQDFDPLRNQFQATQTAYINQKNKTELQKTLVDIFKKCETEFKKPLQLNDETKRTLQLKLTENNTVLGEQINQLRPQNQQNPQLQKLQGELAALQNAINFLNNPQIQDTAPLQTAQNNLVILCNTLGELLNQKQEGKDQLKQQQQQRALTHNEIIELNTLSTQITTIEKDREKLAHCYLVLNEARKLDETMGFFEKNCTTDRLPQLLELKKQTMELLAQWNNSQGVFTLNPEQLEKFQTLHEELRGQLEQLTGQGLPGVTESSANQNGQQTHPITAADLSNRANNFSAGADTQLTQVQKPEWDTVVNALPANLAATSTAVNNAQTAFKQQLTTTQTALKDRVDQQTNPPKIERTRSQQLSDISIALRSFVSFEKLSGVFNAEAIITTLRDKAARDSSTSIPQLMKDILDEYTQDPKLAKLGEFIKPGNTGQLDSGFYFESINAQTAVESEQTNRVLSRLALAEIVLGQEIQNKAAIINEFVGKFPIDQLGKSKPAAYKAILQNAFTNHGQAAIFENVWNVLTSNAKPKFEKFERDLYAWANQSRSDAWISRMEKDANGQEIERFYRAGNAANQSEEVNIHKVVAYCLKFRKDDLQQKNANPNFVARIEEELFKDALREVYENSERNVNVTANQYKGKKTYTAEEQRKLDAINAANTAGGIFSLGLASPISTADLGTPVHESESTQNINLNLYHSGMADRLFADFKAFEQGQKNQQGLDGWKKAYVRALKKQSDHSTKYSTELHKQVTLYTAQNDAQREVNRLTTLKNGLEHTIAWLGAQIARLDKRKNKLNTQIVQQTAELTQLQTELDQLNRAIGTLQDKIQEKEQALEAFSKQHDELGAQAKKIKQDLKGIEQKITTITQDISNFDEYLQIEKTKHDNAIAQFDRQQKITALFAWAQGDLNTGTDFNFEAFKTALKNLEPNNDGDRQFLGKLTREGAHFLSQTQKTALMSVLYPKSPIKPTEPPPAIPQAPVTPVHVPQTVTDLPQLQRAVFVTGELGSASVSWPKPPKYLGSEKANTLDELLDILQKDNSQSN